MHIHGGIAPRVVTLSGWAGQGCWVVSCWTLNNALKDIVLTPRYAKDLEKAPVEVCVCGGGGWGRGQGGGQIQGAPKLVATTGGLWDELQALAKHMQYQCDAHIWRSHSQGCYMTRQNPISDLCAGYCMPTSWQSSKVACTIQPHPNHEAAFVSYSVFHLFSSHIFYKKALRGTWQT